MFLRSSVLCYHHKLIFKSCFILCTFFWRTVDFQGSCWMTLSLINQYVPVCVCVCLCNMHTFNFLFKLYCFYMCDFISVLLFCIFYWCWIFWVWVWEDPHVQICKFMVSCFCEQFYMSVITCLWSLAVHIACKCIRAFTLLELNWIEKK
jgi:hypothetical protein